MDQTTARAEQWAVVDAVRKMISDGLTNSSCRLSEADAMMKENTEDGELFAVTRPRPGRSFITVEIEYIGLQSKPWLVRVDRDGRRSRSEHETANRAVACMRQALAS